MFIGLALKRKEERKKRKRRENKKRRKRQKEDKRMRKKNEENGRKKKSRSDARKKRKKPHEECVLVSLDTCVAHPTYLRNNAGSVTTGTATTILNETITPSEKVVTSVIKT